MSRSTLLPLMLLLPAAGVLNMAFHGARLRRFADELARLSTPQHMTRFKDLVKGQMYAALVQIVVLVAPIALFFYGWLTGILALKDILLYSLLPSVICLVVGLFFKGTEKRVKTLPVSDDLRNERDRVVEIWDRKPFPDW